MDARLAERTPVTPHEAHPGGTPILADVLKNTSSARRQRVAGVAYLTNPTVAIPERAPQVVACWWFSAWRQNACWHWVRMRTVTCRPMLDIQAVAAVSRLFGIQREDTLWTSGAGSHRRFGSGERAACGGYHRV